MAIDAAELAALTINEALKKQGEATIILATGMSQIGFLESLVIRDIDWPQVTVFHLDEYIGLPISHPASFRKYLKERFEERVGQIAKVSLYQRRKTRSTRRMPPLEWAYSRSQYRFGLRGHWRERASGF